MVQPDVRAIHLTGFPGSGKTSWCLCLARRALESEQRVIWISQQPTDPQRFSQVMAGLDLHHAARFHAYFTGEEFAEALVTVRSLIPQLPSTRLVVIEDWDSEQGAAQRIRRENLKSLLAHTSQAGIEIILTSLAYEDASGQSGQEPMQAPSRRWFEKHGFETWYLEHIEGSPGRRMLVKPDDRTEWTLNDGGMETV